VECTGLPVEDVRPEELYEVRERFMSGEDPGTLRDRFRRPSSTPTRARRVVPAASTRRSARAVCAPP
jgi:hypothetical protein